MIVFLYTKRQLVARMARMAGLKHGIQNRVILKPIAQLVNNI